MTDYFLKALAEKGELRITTAVTTQTVAEAQRRHGTWATASAAFGRTLTATLMTGAQYKGDETVTTTIEGSGPIGLIVAQANTRGHVRGYVSNPHVDFELNDKGKLDVARAVGIPGSLSMVRDLGMKDHFTGRVPLISGEIGDDFTYYFARSEQIPSAVGVGVLVNPDQSIKASGGFLIQVLPGAESEVISRVEQRIAEISPISRLIDSGRTPEDLLNDLFPDGDYQILDKKSAVFSCGCSKDRFGKTIAAMGDKELRAMIEEDHGAETTCRFCGNHYHYSEQELRQMLSRENKGNGTGTDVN